MTRKKELTTILLFALISISMVLAAPLISAETNKSRISFSISSFVMGINNNMYHSLSRGQVEIYGSERTSINGTVKTYATLYYKSSTNDYNLAGTTLLNTLSDKNNIYYFNNHFTAPSNNDYYWLEFSVTPQEFTTVTGSGYICNP